MGNGLGKPIRVQSSVKINLLRPKIDRLEGVSGKNSRGVRIPIALGSIFREKDPARDLRALNLKTGIRDEQVQINPFAVLNERPKRPIKLIGDQTILDHGAKLLFGDSSMPLISFARVVKFFQRLGARLGFSRNEGVEALMSGSEMQTELSTICLSGGIVDPSIISDSHSLAVFRNIMQHTKDSKNIEDRSLTDLLHDANSDPQAFRSAVVRRIRELADLVWDGHIATAPNVETVKSEMPSAMTRGFITARQREIGAYAEEAKVSLRDLWSFLTKTKLDLQVIWSRLSSWQKKTLNTVDVTTHHSIDSTLVGVAELLKLDLTTLSNSLNQIARAWDEAAIEFDPETFNKAEQLLLDSQTRDTPKALLRITNSELERESEHPLVVIDDIVYVGEPLGKVMRLTDLDVSRLARYESSVLLPIGEWLINYLPKACVSSKIRLDLSGPYISSTKVKGTIDLRTLNTPATKPDNTVIAEANIKFQNLSTARVRELADAINLFALHRKIIPLTELKSILTDNYRWSDADTARLEYGQPN